jgi:hypothetical protein
MKAKDNITIYLSLLATWIVLLVLQHFAHLDLAQGNLLIYAVDSLAPIPVIVLVVVFLFGWLLDSREQRAHKKQLMFIKSSMFRLELRHLYLANFMALKSPPLSFGAIKTASLEELREMRKSADNVEYMSHEAMESVVDEYVKAKDSWRSFMEIAGSNGFDDIFQDMLAMIHFISDVIAFKEVHPDRQFISEAVKDEAVMREVSTILGDGVRKYLDYAIELKEKEPKLFSQVVGDYELMARLPE